MKSLLDVLPPLTQHIATRWDRMYVLGDPPDYEPEYERSVAAIAAREGREPAEVAYDYLIGEDGQRTLFFPVSGYTSGDFSGIHDMMIDPCSIMASSRSPRTMGCSDMGGRPASRRNASIIGANTRSVRSKL